MQFCSALYCKKTRAKEKWVITNKTTIYSMLTYIMCTNTYIHIYICTGVTVKLYTDLYRGDNWHYAV